MGYYRVALGTAREGAPWQDSGLLGVFYDFSSGQVVERYRDIIKSWHISSPPYYNGATPFFATISIVGDPIPRPLSIEEILALKEGPRNVSDL